MEHATGNSIFKRTSGYVSTTFSLKVAEKMATGKDGYNFTLKYQKSGVDINKRLGKSSPFPNEKEVAVPLNIPADDIIDFRKTGTN